MKYTDQPTEYDARDATTAAPVPEAGEADWSPVDSRCQFPGCTRPADNTYCTECAAEMGGDGA